MGFRGRAGLLLGLRRPALPASGQPDVLRHRRLVAELRPHVPPLRHPVRGRLAGQERQRLRVHDGHPGRSRAAHRRDRVQRPVRRARAARRGLRHDDGGIPRHRPAGLRPGLRRLVADRLRPEMERNFAYLEARLDAVDEMDLADVACLLEDAIDVHDRHWKIHWMLNFAQLSATLNLRAVMEKHRGQVDEPLLGRLQNSATDRNWDSIEALWRMKNEVRDDPELRGAFAAEDVAESSAPCGRRTRPAVHRRAGRAVPARVRLARRLEPRVHLPDRARADGAGHRARPRLPRGRLRLPERDRGDAARHRGRLARDPRRADRRGARGDARRERRQPADGAAHPGPPFLHRPGRQRARPAGAHRDRPEAGRGRPARPARRRDVPSLQRAAGPHRQRVGDRGPRDRGRAPARARGRPAPPSARLDRDGDAIPAGLPVSRQLGLPGPLPPDAVRRPAGHHRPRGVARRRSRGSPASCARSTSSTRCATATSSSAR